MKKGISFICILVSVVMLSFCGCSGNGDDDVPNGYKEISTELNDFDLYVPQNWTEDVSTGMVSAYYSAGDPTNVSVMAWGLEYSDMTIDMWWQDNKADLETVFSGVEYGEEKSAVLDGRDAMRYEYKASLGEKTYKYIQVAAIKNEAVYLITYTAPEVTYEAHLEDFDGIVENFRFN